MRFFASLSVWVLLRSPLSNSKAVSMDHAARRSEPHFDFQGESGALYRFRQIPEPQFLPGSGGNFICARQEKDGVSVVTCGAASDLRQALRLCEKAIREQLADRIYIRLNVSGAVRAAEHADIAARYKPAVAVADVNERS